GIPVAALAPNIATVYRHTLRLSGQLFLAVSQSGRSDDLVESAAMAKAAGALTVALVNVTDSPLAAACDIVLPMEAGPERSVAAFLTGPVRVASARYPIRMFVPLDEAADGLRRLAANLAVKGAALFVADPGTEPAHASQLPVLAPNHPEADALCQIQSFYAMM